MDKATQTAGVIMIAFPWIWALALLPLPLLIIKYAPRAKKQENALYVPFYQSAAAYQQLSQTESKRHWLRRIPLILVWTLLVIAASKPQWIGEPIELPVTGRDLMLAVDISGSMGTEDMRHQGREVTRLSVVKRVVGDFVERRKGDRLGLILFGSQAYLQTPLTFDRNTVRSLLIETPFGIAGGKTAIGDAIGLAVKRLHDRPADSRILILLTDGRNNMGEVAPLQAAQIAAKEGVKIYTIGFGSDELKIPGFLSSRTINPSAELDDTSLNEIAEVTGGIYMRARDSRELAEIYEELDRLEPVDQDQETYRPIKSLFHWPLGMALIISFLMALSHPLLIAWMKRAISRSKP